jgi:hypothetical protein
MTRRVVVAVVSLLPGRVGPLLCAPSPLRMGHGLFGRKSPRPREGGEAGARAAIHEKGHFPASTADSPVPFAFASTAEAEACNA